MNRMHTIKDWTSEHNLHYDVHEFRQMMSRLVHNPSFWLVIALLAFVTLMVILSYFVVGGNRVQDFPLYPTTMGWPYYYPYRP
jgi:amino acid permease